MSKAQDVARVPKTIETRGRTNVLESMVFRSQQDLAGNCGAQSTRIRPRTNPSWRLFPQFPRIKNGPTGIGKVWSPEPFGNLANVTLADIRLSLGA